MIGMLTGLATDCPSHYVGSSPAFKWSECRVKLSGEWHGRVVPQLDLFFLCKFIKISIKTSILTSCMKLKKICKTFLQEDIQYLVKKRYKRFLSHLISKPARSTLTSPSKIMVNHIVLRHSASVFSSYNSPKECDVDHSLKMQTKLRGANTP